MGLTTAERNKRKRERKKREREERLKREKEEEEARKKEELEQKSKDKEEEEVEIEYVAEPLFSVGDEVKSDAASSSTVSNPAAADGEGKTGEGGEEEKKEDIESILLRFHQRASVSAVVTDDEAGHGAGLDEEGKTTGANEDGEDNFDDDDDEESPKEISKRKQREMSRPSVAELKQRVKRADLVEAHDVTAADPDFLIYLKSVAGTVPVPRHWGRKRKYLQGKRGIEKAPFALPDFLVKTGICEIRDATAEDESKMSIKQRNRSRVAPRMGGTDVDYRTLYDAFFKHQTKPKSLTKFGDLYYEGKEYETRKSSDLRPGVLSDVLREALGMTEGSPPPWLINMQRYGPPPSYPNLKIPGLNAPIPEGCSYGYHLNGWGKPPVDAFGRPLYGGDPFGRPTPEGGESGYGDDDGLAVLGGGAGVVAGGLVTSDGKALGRKPWGALPTAADDDEEESSEEEEEETSDEEMAESEEEEEEEEAEEENAAEEGKAPSGTESVLPDGVDSVAPTSALDLRKQPGDETPAAPKSLYTVLDQTAADREKQSGAVFASNVAYVLPGSGGIPADGAESILSKAPMDESGKRKRSKMDDEEDADELGKKFKF